MYRIRLSNRAQKDLDRLSGETWARVRSAIDGLRANPRPDGCVKLAGHERTWRIRVGDYRIIYDIHDDALLILVLRAGHRRDVYRGL